MIQLFVHQPIPLFVCPFCSKNIPTIQLGPLDGQMDLYVKCSCIRDNEYRVLSLKDFIRKLITNEANGIKRGVKIKCEPHQNIFSFYCKTCRAHYCKFCEHYYSDHERVDLSPDDYEELNMSIFDDLKARNKTLTSRLIERIERAQNNRLSIPIVRMREDIQSALCANESVNDDLKLLYQSICKLRQAFKAFPLYQLTKLKRIGINLDQYSEGNEEDIESAYCKLMAYLQRSFVLKQTAVYECIATISAHDQRVFCLIQLKDGRLASCSGDKTIKLWNATSLNHLLTLEGHREWVNCIVQLQDGRLLSCSGDNCIKLWSPEMNCSTTLTGKSYAVQCMIQLSDGRFASGSEDCSIKLWNTTTLRSRTILIGHSNEVKCLLQLNDGRLASGSNDKTVKLWNSTTKECTATFVGHSWEVSCLLQLKDGRLASGSNDQKIFLWDTLSNKIQGRLKGHIDFVRCLVQLSDGSLASGSSDNTIKLWNLENNECTNTLIGHSQVISSLVQINNGRLASCSYDKTIKIW